MMRPQPLTPRDKTYEITRTGTFEVGWHDHASQCGTLGEHLMSYTVTIRGSASDCPKGWLLDNNDIPQYFEGKYRHVQEFRSCESIASDALDAFRLACWKCDASPFYVRVGVSGIRGSEISAEWQDRRSNLDCYRR